MVGKDLEEDMYHPSSKRPNPNSEVKLVTRRLSFWAETEQKLSYFQFGFRSGRSTSGALLKVVGDIEMPRRERKISRCCFIDIKAAFDSVPACLLAERLEGIGVPTYIRRFVTSFTKGREAVLQVGEKKTFEPMGGTPQGSPSVRCSSYYTLTQSFNRLSKGARLRRRLMLTTW